jgi:hypothetical protein
VQWGFRLNPEFWDAGFGGYTGQVTVDGRALSLSSTEPDVGANYLFHGSIGGRRGISLNPFRYHPYQKRGVYMSRNKGYTLKRNDIINFSIEGHFINGDVETDVYADITCTL